MMNGEIVFFKHKYLVQPPVTAADALVKAVDDLSKVVKGLVPTSEQTQVAITKLMGIFKGKAYTDSAGSKKVPKEMYIH